MADQSGKQHGERIAVIESIAKTNVEAIGELKSSVAKIDKQQEVVATTVLANAAHSNERHIEIMNRLDEVRDLLKVTNGSVVDLQKWRCKHEEQATHEDKEFACMGAKLEEIKKSQEDARILDASNTGSRKSFRNMAVWMWAVVAVVVMPIMTVVMGIMAAAIQHWMGWK